MTDDGLTEHMYGVEKRVNRWLLKQSLEYRMDALADLRQSIASLTAMERAVRRDTLVELVDRNGLEAVAQSLDVTPERLLRVISPDG